MSHDGYRIDLVARTATTLYLMELKMDKDAETATQQIDLKEFDKRYAPCGLPIVKVASTSTRRSGILQIGRWGEEILCQNTR